MVWIALVAFCALSAGLIAKPWLSSGGAPRSLALYTALGVTGLACVVTFALYTGLGAPNLADQPLKTREMPPQIQLMQAVAKAEERLAGNPQDAKGWAAIAPVYRQMGRFDEAIAAYDNALKYTQDDKSGKSDLMIGRIETLLLQSEGTFTPDISQALNQAAALAPQNPRAGFLIALMADQTSTPQEAAQAWSSFLTDFAATGGPMLEIARQRLATLKAPINAPSLSGPDAPTPNNASLEKASPDDSAPQAPRGPTRDDIAAASAMSQDQRSAMIDGMVAGLAARLESEPNDLAGWERLIRSYQVLGRSEDAASALVKARETFAGDQEALARLKAFETP